MVQAGRRDESHLAPQMWCGRSVMTRAEHVLGQQVHQQPVVELAGARVPLVATQHPDRTEPGLAIAPDRRLVVSGRIDGHAVVAARGDEMTHQCSYGVRAESLSV